MAPGSGKAGDASKYVGRWRHRAKIVFRVWPKWREAHRAILSETEIPINKLRIGDGGIPELWHQKKGTSAYVFEIPDDSFDLLVAMPKAGARMSGKIVVRAPGTADSRVKKECWAEMTAVAYADAPARPATPWGRSWSSRAPHEIRGDTPEDALGLEGMGGGRIVFFEGDDDIDDDLILREVLENDAMIVLNDRPGRGRRVGVSSAAGRRLIEKAMFWTVPGRDPCEDGGALRGYQFPDRIVRWMRRVDPARRDEAAKSRLEAMHATTREKGRSARRRHFVENVVNRFAERVGVGRQRVMARFLDEGVVDWLLRSVENVRVVPCRETSALLAGRITDAVNALEFYYRAVESLGRGQA